MSSPRPLRLLASIAGLAAVLIGARYVRYAYRDCHPVRTTVTAAELDLARRTLPGLREVRFPGDGGITLRGWLTPSTNGALVVLVHGLGGNRASLLPDAGVLAKHGYGSLLFDQRAHGESDGAAATWGYREALDLRGAVSFAEAQPGVSQIALLGFSVGASAVAHAAAEDPRVRAVILYATWTSLRDENAYKRRKYGGIGERPALLGFRWSGVDVGAISPIDDVPRLAPRPLLMIAGTEDTDTPPWVMDRVFAAAREPKELWSVPGVGHGGYVQAAPAEYETRVIGFLSRALGK
jgi:uncharacterized protein